MSAESGAGIQEVLFALTGEAPTPLVRDLSRIGRSKVVTVIVCLVLHATTAGVVADYV